MDSLLTNEEARMKLEKQYNDARAKEKKRRLDAHIKIQNGAAIHAIFGRWLSQEEVSSFIRICKKNISVFEKAFETNAEVNHSQKPPNP